MSYENFTNSIFVKDTVIVSLNTDINICVLDILIWHSFQMSATMFGTTGGPMLGLFSLGILTTRANSKVSQTASAFRE